MNDICLPPPWRLGGPVFGSYNNSHTSSPPSVFAGTSAFAQEPTVELANSCSSPSSTSDGAVAGAPDEYIQEQAFGAMVGASHPSSSTEEHIDPSAPRPQFPEPAPYKDIPDRLWPKFSLCISRTALALRQRNLADIGTQALVVRAMLTFLHDNFGYPLPYFANKTPAQLRALLELDPMFRSSVQEILSPAWSVSRSMRTLVHYLCSPLPGSAYICVPVDDETTSLGQTVDTNRARSLSPIPVSAEHAEPMGLPTGTHPRSTDCVDGVDVPPYRLIAYKGRIEQDDFAWEKLLWIMGSRGRRIYSTMNACETQLQAHTVHTILTYIKEKELATAPYFDHLTPAQIQVLLERDAMFSAAVRDMKLKADKESLDDYSMAMRLLVNYLCQRQRGVLVPERRVHFAPIDDHSSLSIEYFESHGHRGFTKEFLQFSVLSVSTERFPPSGAVFDESRNAAPLLESADRKLLLLE